VGWTGRGTPLPSLTLFSSRPSSPFSHPTSPFPGPFLPVSLYPVHSLSETPLNRHRNVYVKLTPQSYNEDVHITEWHSTRDMMSVQQEAWGIHVLFLFNQLWVMCYIRTFVVTVWWTMGTFKQVCRKNHICRGPDETHTVDTIENRVICQDWFVIT
jgi:hypothetical protein